LIFFSSVDSEEEEEEEEEEKEEKGKASIDEIIPLS
jgi:hypothetical protein